jgi:hypothetical protein
MIASFMIMAMQLPAPPPISEPPPPAYITTTTSFRCKGEEQSISVRTVGGTSKLVEIRSGGHKISEAAWRVIQKKLADFSSVGEPDLVCSARGDMIYLTAYRGAEGHTFTLTFSGGTAKLAEPR